MERKKLSTTAIAKKINVEVSDIFNTLRNNNWIKRTGNQWELTEIGESKGGCNKGDYIVWDIGIGAEIKTIIEAEDKKNLSVTKISEKVNIIPQKLNLIFSELGWIEKDMRGWVVTKLGKIIGGKQKEHTGSGSLYVLWSENILENNALKESLERSNDTENGNTDFRSKFPANFRTLDGHFVRSKAEVIIDNYLYQNQIIHAYERKVPIEEELYCDFYIPAGKKVYIEYWGLEEDKKYANRKEVKIDLYKKSELNLIELRDSDISNLDDILPGKLLKYEIKGYM